MKQKKVSLNRNFIGGIALFSSLFVFTGTISIALAATEQQVLVDQSQITLRNFVLDPNMESLVNTTQNAKSVVIVPSIIKGGFFLGGSGGMGGGAGAR